MYATGGRILPDHDEHEKGIGDGTIRVVIGTTC